MMAENLPTYPKEFLEQVQAITAKRAKFVIDFILAHGQVTTEDLADAGYNHAPRAARDVREAGIPLVTKTTKSERTGKQVAAYSFGDLSEVQTERVAGRATFSKKFRGELYQLCGGRCQICNGKFEERYLQIDHRVPYEVGGELNDHSPEHFMMLCGSCNRAKSWSCEHCENWLGLKKPELCMTCYWGSPENYNHIALEQVRRLDLQWNGDEVQYYDALKIIADQHGIEVPEFIKQIVASRTTE